MMAFITCDEVFDWSMQQVGASGSAPIEQQPQKKQQQQQPMLRCPRCESSNTKFCYYNNYSRSQPRHFCKACRRHWTAGGTLRSVPVGGAHKNNKHTTTSNTNTTTITTQLATTPFNASGKMEESSIYPDQAMMFYNTPPLTASDQAIIINPLPVVSAVCSLTGGDTAALLDLMPGSRAGSTWMQDPSTLSTSYFNWTWLDDTLDFINSPVLPAVATAAADQLRPVMD